MVELRLFGALRIAGLGGVYRHQVWAPAGPDREGTPARYDSPEAMSCATRKGDLWRDGLPRRHRASIFRRTTKLLSQPGRRISLSVMKRRPAIVMASP